MEFRDLKAQYNYLKKDIDDAILSVLEDANFISGKQVTELEQRLASYVGVKHCITCANGTDALLLALMTWGIGPGDAVFVPDFTFFSTGEVVGTIGATPIFVDVYEDTYNMDYKSLEDAIRKVIDDGVLNPRAVIAVDLFGQPAEYDMIRRITDECGLLLLEDAAQGFGGVYKERRACSFGDISTTSFFPAKPLGCYGDGGAVFTDNDEWAELIRSLRVHGKGTDKYDNVRIGMNSRLDTIQAAVLNVKLTAFEKYELEAVNSVADKYNELLANLAEHIALPTIREGCFSSWAQYTIKCATEETRDSLQLFLRNAGVPSMVYYKKPMHIQAAFEKHKCVVTDLSVSENICSKILSLPMSPYMNEEQIIVIVNSIKHYFIEKGKKIEQHKENNKK